MALYFHPSYSKTYHMPNSQNSSNSSHHNAGKGGPKHRTSRDSSPKSNPERSDLKQGGHSKDHPGDTGRSSNQGRKSASGGSEND